MRAWVIVGIGVAFALGCAGGAAEDSGAAPEAGPSGGDGVEQPAICEAYLDCLAAADPAALADVQATYGASGTCWTDAETAEQCAAACQTGLEQMHDAHPGVSECADGSPTTTYDLEGDWIFEQTAVEGDCHDRYLAEITQYGMTLAAADGSAMEAEVHAVWAYRGDEWQFLYVTDCTFEDDTLLCENGGDSELLATLSGTYADGVLEIETTWFFDFDGVSCTDRYTLEGVRQ